MRLILNLLLGLLFGLGLIVSGMSNPAKVLNFLDIAAIARGTWDASLAFVMGGALVVTFIGYRLVFRRPQPLLADTFHVPTKTRLDLAIIVGPAIFGIGWGIAGFCPGPAITDLAVGGQPALIFVAAMMVGMAIARLAPRLIKSA